MSSQFTHLHVHSHYSLLEGLAKIDELVLRAKELGMNSLALTDSGNLYGAIQFYEAAHKHGIKPIIGMEAYLAPESRLLKRAKIDTKNYPLVLLATNRTGYENLKKLASIGFLEGFYYKPRIDEEVLQKYGEGLIALTGTTRGAIPQAIINHDFAGAEATIKRYQQILGSENVYLELSYHPNVEYQDMVNAQLKEFGAQLNAPLVAAQNVYYLNPDDAEAQDVLLCIQNGKTTNDQRRFSLLNDDYSLRSPEDMTQLFANTPEAITNTAAIAERCQLDLKLNAWNFPAFPIPENKDAATYLHEQVYVGITERVPTITPEIKERLEYELEIIKTKGYATYFLVVADFVNWTRDHKIIATTRGSAAGSLVSYAIGITTVNPLDFRLPFERFLNPFRPSPPDIDMDFADTDRDRVIAYVTEKYGADKVAQICTFGAMMARGSVRDVGRALGYPYSFCDQISKLIPFGTQGFQMTIQQALEQVPELKAAYQNDERTRRLINLAQRIEGCARHCSIHAAGVVISPTPLTDFTPLQREAGGGDKIITQYDMHSVEAAGLLKMDFLGIRNLSILGKAIELVKALKDIEINPYKIALDDKKTFALLARGQTMGLFQLSGTGMTRYLKELRPSTIDDIMAMVALFRPGPMESIPAYIRRKNGDDPVEYLDPRLEKILDRSFGILVYQDDVLLIAIHLAGYNWEEADKLRKAMGKKIPAEMAKQKNKFLDGCQANGLVLAKAVELWKLIEPFAAYGFNKAHAASYGVVAYQTAYMKANFPTEFMCAVMTEESHDLEKVAEAVRECRALAITVLPPDVNESGEEFTIINDQTIRFGLAAIKNLGIDVVRAIQTERTSHGAFTDLENFLSRVSTRVLNKKSLESLIRVGALDSFGDRIIFNDHVETLLRYGREQHEIKTSGQNSLFLASGVTRIPLPPPMTTSARVLTLADWEQELLGIELSAHPLDAFKDDLKNLLPPLESITVENNDKRRVRLAGVLKRLKTITTKKNDLMLFAQLEDQTGALELVFFPSIYQRFQKLLTERALVVVEGTINSRQDALSLVVDRFSTLSTDTIPDLVNALQRGDIIPCADDPQPLVNLPPTTVRPHPTANPVGPSIRFTIPRLEPTLTQQLKNLCEQYPGPYRVFIRYQNNSHTPTTIATNFSIAYNEKSTLEFSSLLGTNNVEIV